jgi:hypothetical protein
MTDLISALREVLQAVQAEETARDKYEGVECGYHGWRFFEDRQKAEERFTNELTTFIDARVAAAMAPTGEPK